MARRNTVEIIINAEDRASRTISGVGESIQGVGRVALAGIGIATAAVTAFGVSSVAAFSTFERSLNEVFTLLPGISGEAMDEMSAQVQALAVEMGTLPEEIIPALYQALSAGVPPDNVFDFLETANMAAIGGVTDLETAVDGITSVVNAYGAEVLDAAQASDVLFTAVRLGKTDFTELSNYIYQVIPTAASLGVSFEGVAAGMATITAQGVPTRVAATQLRAMLVELSRAGTATADVFTEMAGQSFADFIASGNNVQDALILMEQAAEQNGVSLADMFGSVEAGNAALALTGAAAETFTDNLAEMENAAGATEAAYEQMDQGISRGMDRLRAKFSVLQIQMGERLAPIAEWTIELISGILDAASASLEGGFLGDLVDSLTMAVRMIHFFVNDIREFGLFEAILSIFGVRVRRDVAGAVEATFEPFLMTLGLTRDAANKLSYSIGMIVYNILDLVKPLTEWIRNNIELEDVLQALGIAISVVIIPALWGIATAITGILGPFGLLVLGIRIFKEAWEKDLLGIRTTATQVFEETIKPLLSDIATFIEQKIVPAIQDLGKWLGGIWESVRPTLQMLHDWFVKDAVPAIVDVIKNSLLPFIDEIGVTLGNIWKIVEPALSRLFEWFVKDALPAILSFISEKVIPAVGVFIDILRTIWDIVGPGLEKFVNYLVETGFPAVGVIINTIIDVIKLLIATIKAIWSEVSPALETFGEGIGRLLQPVIDYYTWLFNIVSDVVKKLREFNAINVGQAAAVIEQGPAAILDPKQFDVGGYTGNAPGVAGVVHGREYVVPEQGALVVRGEGGGAGGANIENLIVQYNGIPQSQQEADSGVRFMVNALESEGVILS